VSLDQYVGRQLKGKTDAEAEADQIRAAIRAGVFSDGAPAQAPTADSISLDTYSGIFLERYSKARQKASWQSDRSILIQIAAFVLPSGRRFGAKLIGAITEDDVESFLQALKDKGRAASTRNKYLTTLRVMSHWGQRKGYISRPWIGEFTELKREKHARRSRRVRPDEEVRLLKACAPSLYRLTVAALETGCRLGELLSLQWQDVDLTRREFIVRAVNAKAKTHRHIPISRRLKAVLEMARHDPAGYPCGPHAFVFGDEIGRQVTSPKKAWETMVLKAHGHVPQWVKGTHRLTSESRAAYRDIDLRFHDLRHEAGSRWLEAGVPLHHVKALLGHANVSTTDTYLNAGRIHLQESMERAEPAKNATNLPHDTANETVLGRTEQADSAAKSLIN
jgi:integrase